MKIGDAMREVSTASRAFEARWTLASLKLAEPSLYGVFREQQADWEAALVKGDSADVVEQTGGMVRGWLAVAAAMEGREPSAYQIGQCPNSGLKVAITNQLAVATELPSDTVLVTPDEVAMLLAAQRDILRVKQLFPGATVEEIAKRQDEP